MSSQVALPEPAAGDVYAVKLPIFEGPLDLLLHLIRLNEVDVTDIPIARITEQYVETLELMTELNLDVAGEYLVMAATLAWIKSRMLLPAPAGEEEGEEVDPRAELVARLLEYQRFKEAAEALAERPRLERDVFRVLGPEIEPTPDAEREIQVGLVQLLEAFRRVVRGVPRGPGVHEVEGESITVHERMRAVMERLEASPQLAFEQVLDPGGATRPTRTMLVTTFLAILELVRLAAIRVYQGLDQEGVPEGPIRLRVAETGGVPWRERIAEIM
jgi:segregation and condensation protein A